MFIVTVLDIKSQVVDIEGVYDTKLNALDMLTTIFDQSKGNIVVKKQDDILMYKVYDVSFGYIYDTKSLAKIYQICEA